MPKVIDVINEIEKFAPPCLAESYDNVGLMVGSKNTDVTGVYIALNLSERVIEDAINNGCNFILAHHPLIFNPLTSVDYDSISGKLVKLLVKNDICVYSAHTSADNAPQSIGQKNLVDIGCNGVVKDGEVVYGSVNNVLVKDIAERVRKVTGDKNLLVAKPNKVVKKVAHVNGSGGRMDDLLAVLKENDVDLYISSEFKYSFLCDLVSEDIAVIEINHFNAEKSFITIMENILSKNFDRVISCPFSQNPYEEE